MITPLPNSAQKVQQAVSELGFEFQIVELDASSRTSQDAANAIGCTVAQIAKSLVFRTVTSHKPILVIASGPNRVDVDLISALLGEKIIKADADFVRESTGFAFGGIPPVGQNTPIQTYIDADLFKLEVIWAAAGTPHAVFKLTPTDLAEMTGGQVFAVH